MLPPTGEHVGQFLSKQTSALAVKGVRSGDPPQSFRKDIILGATAFIHADMDFFSLQALQIFEAGKVTALIAVPDLRLGVKQGIVHSGEHEIHFRGLAERSVAQSQHTVR